MNIYVYLKELCGKMNSSIKVGTVFGIPIKLHITFLLVLPLFIWVFAENPAPFGFKDGSFKYLFSIITTVLLFSCIILHELSHSFVALKNGINIRSITLFIFGGLASIEKIPRDPKVEAKMAIAGPALSIGLGALFFSLYMVFAEFFDGKSGIVLFSEMVSSLFMEGGGIDVFEVTLLFFILGYINFILAIFNLLPAFPMDGGRFLRAFLAMRMPYLKATRWAVVLGKIMAVLMGIFGILESPPQLFLVIIAFFVYIGASEEEKATIVDMSLEGLKVKDIMTEDVVSVSPDTSISELCDMMFKGGHKGYPVVYENLEGSELRGIVTFHDVQKISQEERNVLNVSDIMTKGIVSISSEDDAIEAFKVMSQYNIGRLIVTEYGKMVGILSKEDLIRAIKLKRD